MFVINVLPKHYTSRGVSAIKLDTKEQAEQFIEDNLSFYTSFLPEYFIVEVTDTSTTAYDVPTPTTETMPRLEHSKEDTGGSLGDLLARVTKK